MSVTRCPTCSSDRCGNHAACARRAAKNVGNAAAVGLQGTVDVLAKRFDEVLRDAAWEFLGPGVSSEDAAGFGWMVTQRVIDLLEPRLSPEVRALLRGQRAG